MPCVKSGYCYLAKLRWSNVIKGLGVLLNGRLAHPLLGTNSFLKI